MAKALDPIAQALAEVGVAKSAARELTDGAIRCSVPGCGGIVRKDFVVPTKTPVGLCPQREVHDLLKAADPKVADAIRSLVRLSQMHRAGWKPQA